MRTLNGKPVKIVFVSTAPRTGSMWLYNVTREVLGACGYDVVPKKVPQSEEQVFELANSFRPSHSKQVLVLKTHNHMKPGIPHTQILTTVRDPREVAASFRSFMKGDFESAVNAGVSMVEFNKAYKTYPQDYLLSTDYGDLEGDPESVVKSICRFLGEELSAETIDNIVTTYSKDSVKKRVAVTEQRVSEHYKAHNALNPNDVVVTPSGVRAFDAATGFQSGHVSNRKTGEWQTVFTEEEVKALNLQFEDWLNRE